MMHSRSSRSALCTSIERPQSSGGTAKGTPSTSAASTTRMKWFGTTESVASNHHADICVSTWPLPGMPVGRTVSNAEMRSVVTMSSVSPRS